MRDLISWPTSNREKGEGERGSVVLFADFLDEAREPRSGVLRIEIKGPPVFGTTGAI